MKTEMIEVDAVHYPQEEDRGPYGLQRPKEIWRLTVRLGSHEFQSRKSYASVDAAFAAARRLEKKLHK